MILDIQQKRQKVLVLGATGSIGRSALDVISRNPDRYEVVGLVAHSNMDAMAELAEIYQPEFLALTNPQVARDAQIRWPQWIWHHQQSAVQAYCGSCNIDIVIAAIVGAAGLLPTMSAVNAGKKVLLANKESLVLTGALMMNAAKKSGAQILPVDSEHNAIFQCLPPQFNHSHHLFHTHLGVEKLWLTASGGPFRQYCLHNLETVTPAQAINHPNWQMGKKISVDSATMANKGLELIEAHFLFGLPSSQIEVVIHPQSIIHSLVQYCDGGFVAQMGCPDMRIPIAHCLAYPERIQSGAKPLNLFELSNLSFEQPNLEKFPALKLARLALEAGGVLPAVFNAANEVAVDAFLTERIAFTQIANCIEFVLEKHEAIAACSIEVVLDVDRQARHNAKEFCKI